MGLHFQFIQFQFLVYIYRFRRLVLHSVGVGLAALQPRVRKCRRTFANNQETGQAASAFSLRPIGLFIFNTLHEPDRRVRCANPKTRELINVPSAEHHKPRPTARAHA